MKKIIFNGEEIEVASADVESLTLELNLSSTGIAIECNKEILPKSEYAKKLINSGDVFEVVQFVGGG